MAASSPCAAASSPCSAASSPCSAASASCTAASSSSASASSSASSCSVSMELITSDTGLKPRAMNTISRSNSVNLQLTRMSMIEGDSRAAADSPVELRAARLLTPAMRGSAVGVPNPLNPLSRPSCSRACSASTRSISMRFNVYPSSEFACVRRMYASSPVTSLSSSPPTPTGHQPGPPPGDGQPSSYRVIMHIPMLDRNESCSDSPSRFCVLNPSREMSIRSEATERPRS
mmetsp:Transcript_23985/g.59461  ORF Transcript_23985/g.59461 Transcript_23985/m.59461 type:complete len:231 (+) Transcript_23985:1087-1779(+)